MNLKIRMAVNDDILDISELFYETIQNINIKDYNNIQVNAWALNAYDREKWKFKIKNQYFIVAIIDTRIVGFSSIDKNGYLDYMFIHKDFQRRGIARALLVCIENKAKIEKYDFIYSDVSKTAKKFFISNDYIVELEQNTLVNNTALINYKMKKKFS